MKRRFGLLFDAYLHSIFVAGVVIDVLFCTFVLIDTSNNKAPLFLLLMARLLLLFVVLYLYRLLSGTKTVSYYRNLGFSKRRLLGGIAALDYLLAIVLITGCYVW